MDGKSVWRAKTRQWATTLLGGQCQICGSRSRLEFDHVDAKLKSFEISVAIRDGYSRERILLELSKCQLLCKQHNLQKSRMLFEHSGGANKIHNPEHGTAAMYGREKCRCDVCKVWKKEYRAGRVDSLGNICGQSSFG